MSDIIDDNGAINKVVEKLKACQAEYRNLVSDMVNCTSRLDALAASIKDTHKAIVDMKSYCDSTGDKILKIKNIKL